MSKNVIPVIDLFAGPGGLGEGFSAFKIEGNKSPFRIRVSIEKDPLAHRTLLTRAFFRNLVRKGTVHEFYYSMLKSGFQDSLPAIAESDPNRLIRNAFALAQKEALCLELGNPAAEEQIISSIGKAIGGISNWILIGGPPCQAYSLAGRSRNKGVHGYTIEKDHRSVLYKEYLKVISKWRPAIFLMENVKGMLSARIDGDLIFHQILNDLRNPGKATGNKPDDYEITPVVVQDTRSPTKTDLFGKNDEPSERDFIVRCEQHGIPQQRHRLILMGIRRDVLLGNQAWQDGSWRLEKSDTAPPTVEDVISDLPPLTSYLSSRENAMGRRYKAEGTWEELRKFIREAAGLDVVATKGHWTSRYSSQGTVEERVIAMVALMAGKMTHRKNRQGAPFIPVCRAASRSGDTDLSFWYYDKLLKGVCNHECRSHMDSDLERYLFTSAFAKTTGRSPVLGIFPPELQPRHRSAGTGHFNDRFRVQVGNSPATTITSHISKDGHYFIHPDPSQCRSLTVREAARIQTFPDNYVFCGPRTSQFVQVGNAVPPFLALQLAGCVWKLLKSRS
jgi:DNA (cytosine-5)-methyltransferase 1